ncbi:MAG TPA: hypothetical protein PKH33_16565, partial [bacterium]|nr:hypothetical protein [bacterium]
MSEDEANRIERAKRDWERDRLLRDMSETFKNPDPTNEPLTEEEKEKQEKLVKYVLCVSDCMGIPLELLISKGAEKVGEKVLSDAAKHSLGSSAKRNALRAALKGGAKAIPYVGQAYGAEEAIRCSVKCISEWNTNDK